MTGQAGDEEEEYQFVLASGSHKKSVHSIRVFVLISVFRKKIKYH